MPYRLKLDEFLTQSIIFLTSTNLYLLVVFFVTDCHRAYFFFFFSFLAPLYFFALSTLCKKQRNNEKIAKQIHKKRKEKKTIDVDVNRKVGRAAVGWHRARAQTVKELVAFIFLLVNVTIFAANFCPSLTQILTTSLNPDRVIGFNLT